MLTRQLAGFVVVAVLVIACSVDRATASPTAASTTTSTTIPTLPTRATTPAMVYGVIPDAQWVECGRAYLWVTQPALEKPTSIDAFERRLVKLRLDEPFVAVGFAIERAFYVDEQHPPGIIFSIVSHAPSYPRMVRAWTDVAKACKALVATADDRRA